MQKQDLIEVIKKFAALPENQRSPLPFDAVDRDDIIWDFVASDVSSLAIFKSSPFSQQDLDEAMAEVAAEDEESDIKELRRVIEKQQSKVDKMQAELSANRKKLQSIKKRPVMSRNF
jgi:uncharacterized coiled-coil protein SlyX